MAQNNAAFAPIFLEDIFEEHARVAWRIEEAQPDPHNPLLVGEYPWDDATPAAGHGTILQDPIDGKFKGWTPVMSNDTPEQIGECEFRLAYIESDDGVNWRRPMLDLCPFPGFPRSNVLFDNDSGGRTTYSSVFIDPQANPQEPYEMFCFREVHWRCPARCVAGFNQTPAKDDIDVWKYYGLYRYRSRDGIHWRGIEGPLNLKTGDSCYIHRDPKLGYVAHHKSSVQVGPGNVVPRYECAPDVCRVTQRRSSPNGSEWSAAEPLIYPDRHDDAADQIMEVGRFPYGGGFLSTVTMYHARTQRMDVQFAASPDGTKFFRPIPHSPALPNAPLGDFGGGMIWPYRTLIQQGERLYMYYGALSGLHGDVYQTKPDMRMFRGGALCRASWEMGRFFGLVNADGDGLTHAYATTKLMPVSGRNLVVNAATKRGGKIIVELLDENMKPIPGFAKSDCVAFEGDSKPASIRWAGGAVPKVPQARIRVFLSGSCLYGLEWAQGEV